MMRYILLLYATVMVHACPPSCPQNYTCANNTATGVSSCVCQAFQFGPTCSIYCNNFQTCSGHGECDPTFGVCVCDPSWFGVNCSVFTASLYQKVQQVTPLGYNLTLDYFGYEGVYFPPFSLSQTVTVQLGLYDPSVIPPNNALMRHAGTIKDYSPHGQVFNNPVTSWLRFNVSSLYQQDPTQWANTLGLYYYNDTQRYWQPIQGLLDVGSQSFIVYLNHFSKYSVIEQIPAVSSSTPFPPLGIMGIVVGGVFLIAAMVLIIYVTTLRNRHRRRRELRMIRKAYEKEGYIPEAPFFYGNDKKMIRDERIPMQDTSSLWRGPFDDSFPSPRTIHAQVPVSRVLSFADNVNILPYDHYSEDNESDLESCDCSQPSEDRISLANSVSSPHFPPPPPDQLFPIESRSPSDSRLAVC